jgi:hypothetical protein
VGNLYSINDQRQRAINRDDTACRFLALLAVGSLFSRVLLRMSPIIWMVEEAMLTCGLHCAWRICSRTQSTREGNEETASRSIWTLIVVLTVFNQFMDELIDCCDRIGGLGHIDVVDMPV